MHWLKSGILHSKLPEALVTLCFIFAIIKIMPLCPYLLVVAIMADLIRLVACGSWYYAYQHSTSHKNSPQDDKAYIYGQYVKILLITLSVILALFPRTNSLVVSMWVIIAVISVAEMVRTVVYVLHTWNASWLGRFNGRISYLDKLCITRYAVAVVLPFITLHGGKMGLIITMLTIFAYGICAEAYELLRSNCQGGVNRAYCWVDTIARKTLFIGESIAIMALIARRGYIMKNVPVVILLVILMIIAFLKEVLTAWWHISRRYSFSDRKDDRSLTADIIRNVFFYIWIIVSCIILLVNSGVNFIVLGASTIAIISILSLYFDNTWIKRMPSSYYYGEPH